MRTTLGTWSLMRIFSIAITAVETTTKISFLVHRGSLCADSRNSWSGLFGKSHRFPLTVEVGSGAGGHLQHVRHHYDQYIMTDIRDYRPDKTPRTDRPFLFANAEHLPFANNSVDRIVSTCLLHHETNPLAALSQWRNVVRAGGAITIFLPCDPGLLWRLGRQVGPRRKALKHGVDYDFLMALSHRNHVGSIIAILSTVFKNDTVRRTGFPIPILGSWNLNLAFVYQITKNSIGGHPVSESPRRIQS